MKTAASNKKNLPAPRLLRSGAVTAGATFMSRILGMFRDIAIAGLLGAGLSADVYFFANRIPNFFRRLFAEGAFAQAFVPVMTKTKRDKSSAELKELAAKSAGTLGLIVLIISIIGMVLSPVVTAIFGWGWFEAWYKGENDAGKFIEGNTICKESRTPLFERFRIHRIKGRAYIGRKHPGICQCTAHLQV